MVANIRNRKASGFALAILASLGVLGSYASTVLGGTKTGTALGVLLTLSPALLYAALIVPVVFPFGLYAALTPLDALTDLGTFGTLTRLLGLVSGAALLFYMLRTKRFAEPNRGVAFWVLLYLWMGASAFWAIDVNSATELLPTALQLFGLYIVVSMIRIDARQFRWLVGCIIAGSTAASGYLMYLYHSGAANFRDRLWLRTDSASLNPDHFAGALLLPIALTLIALLWTRSFQVRILSLCCLLVMLAAVGLTGARGPELSLAVMIVFLIVRDCHRKQLAIVGASLMAFGAIVSGPSFAQRWASAISDGGAGRTDIWRVGWIAFEQNWLIGVGYNNFAFAYDRAFMSVFQPLYANWHRAPHNILLSSGVELGIIGVILLVLAWYSEFRMLRQIGPSDARYPVRLALEASIIGLFIAGMFVNVLVVKYTWLAFMLAALLRNTSVENPSRA